MERNSFFCNLGLYIKSVLVLILLLGGSSSAWADETLTVYDGTNYSYSYPFSLGYANYALKGEYIIPSSELTSLEDKTITGITLYTRYTSSKVFGTLNVYLKEVENAEPYPNSKSSFVGTTGAVKVFEGTLTVNASKEMIITFDDGYDYNGGNLYIGFSKDKGGNSDGCYFMGDNTQTSTYTTCSSYSSTETYSSAITTGDRSYFKPKTTFSYVTSSPYKKPATLTATSVTSESAVIEWTRGSNDDSETSWDLEYKTSASAVWNEVHGISASTLSYSLSSLSANTSYDVRVKAHYDANESAWKTMTFKTEKVSTPADGFSDDFESDKGWELINGTLTNKWTRGTATNNGGSYSLYISNDGGTTNAYSNSHTLVYASKLFSFETGDYTISYDWKAKGETSYDFLRVALVPANVEFTASNSSSLPTGFTATKLPTGWIAADGGSKLNLQEDWQSKSVNVTITSNTNYQVVFVWRNDGSTDNNPPAAIDNFSISRLVVSEPTDLTSSNITSTSADLSWTDGDDETTWQVSYSTTTGDHSTTTVDFTDKPYTLSGLNPSTTYYVSIRAKKSITYSNWSDEISFTTNGAVTLGSNGFTTFACPYPVDLTAETQTAKGFTAYRATVDAGNCIVRFTSDINQIVPANTGVLIEGDANETYEIPVAVSGTPLGSNDLLVNSTGGTFDAVDGYTYFAMKKNSSPLTFGTFNPSTTAIPSNKAYLKVLTKDLPSGARTLRFVFDDNETTGIKNVDAQKTSSKDIYFNLNGQRVAKPTKGMYISNGKKYIVK